MLLTLEKGFKSLLLRTFLGIFVNPNWIFGRGILFAVAIKMSVMIASTENNFECYSLQLKSKKKIQWEFGHDK